MPSTSARFRPASDIASAAALLMRSSVEEPSCLPNAVNPTPGTKLMLRGLRALSAPFRDGAQAPDPDSRDSGFAAAQRPGMTTENAWHLDDPQYDFGRPSTFSAMKLRMSCGLIGA